MCRKIGFISTRFAGTDGVSLEASKWATVLEQSGHECFWFCGESDRDPDRTMLVPDAHFKDVNNRWINDRIWGRKIREPIVTDAIYFKKPMLVNRYAIFIKDIEPQGFDLILMDGYLTRKNVSQVREVIESGELLDIMVNKNFDIAKHHYSFNMLRTRLDYLINIFFGS